MWGCSFFFVFFTLNFLATRIPFPYQRSMPWIGDYDKNGDMEDKDDQGSKEYKEDMTDKEAKEGKDAKYLLSLL